MLKRMAIVATVAALAACTGTAYADVAEDGSYINDPNTYYSPAPSTSETGWVVIYWVPGIADNCGMYFEDATSADSEVTTLQSLGYAAAKVHSNPSILAKMEDCS